ncbi:MAG: hypothetical protein IKM38_09765 [Christensenellaceae bacterium]|nr:hypothetical protein [Christensenellaceae bacterium]
MMRKGWIIEMSIIAVYAVLGPFISAFRGEYTAVLWHLASLLFLYIAEKILAETVRRNKSEKYQHPIILDLRIKEDMQASGVSVWKLAISFILPEVFRIMHVLYGEKFFSWLYALFAEKGYVFFNIVYFSALALVLLCVVIFILKLHRLYKSVFPYKGNAE